MRKANKGNFENDSYIIYYINIGVDFEPEELPISLSDIVENDFFNSEERCSDYEAYYKAGKYEELYSLVNDYIEEENPDPSDSAFKILDLVEPLRAEIDKCTVAYDDFTEMATIYYKGITELSSSINIVPYMELNSGGMDIKIGFIRGDWLFFDNITIKLDSGDTISHNYKLYDVNTDVLSNANTFEWVTMGSSRDIEKLAKSDETTIRFQNRDTGEVLDHPLSGDEIQAIKTIYLMMLIMISPICYSGGISRYKKFWGWLQIHFDATALFLCKFYPLTNHISHCYTNIYRSAIHRSKTGDTTNG